jgi:uncharacterized membrane protein
MKTKDFLSHDEKAEIISAIREAELRTSGEVRVHIEKKCKGDILDRAAYIFEKLKMHKTDLRNGVLFYLALNDKKFAILGDRGINEKVPENFWNDIKIMMEQHFMNGQMVIGLKEGILTAGEHLKIHFPHKKDDVNELSDEISFSN